MHTEPDYTYLICAVILHTMLASTDNKAGNATFVPIPPPHGPGVLLPLHSLGEYVFEDFCRDIFSRESGIVSCDNYGERGQAQRGIDLKAIHRDGHCEVGQCKCKKSILPHEIRKASDEFLKHRRYWRAKDTRRFVLLVSCKTNSTKCDGQIEEETNRFRKMGITYEVWNQVRITEKARDNADLVTMYFPPHGILWAQHIGASSQVGGPDWLLSISGSMRVIEASLTTQLRLVSDDAASDRIAQIMSAWSRGLVSQARRQLSLLQSMSIWTTASPHVKASAHRIDAGLILGAEGSAGIDAAAEAAAKAHTLDPTADQRPLLALIAHLRSGPEAALEELDGRETLEILNLKAQLHLELGELRKAALNLEEIESSYEADAETNRTWALLKLAQGDIDSAILAISEAVQEAPESAAVCFAEAAIEFWSSVSPSVVPHGHLAIPAPVPWRFVKRDDSTLSRLAHASNRVESLIGSGGGELYGDQILQSLRLACLANDVSRQDDAAALAEKLLSAQEFNVSAVNWCLVRGWTFEPDPVIDQLLALPPADDLSRLEVLIRCYLAVDKADDALNILEDEKDSFLDQGESEAYSYWRAVCLVESRRVPEALSALSKHPASIQLARARLSLLRGQPGLDQEVEDALDLALKIWEESHDSRLLLDICTWKAELKDWAFVVEYGDMLLSGIQTDAALLMYSIALNNEGHYERCLDVLTNNASLFPEKQFPPSFLSIRAASKRALGLIPQALDDAKSAVDQDASLDNVLQLLDLQLRHGDQAGMVLTGRMLLDMTPTPVTPLIRLAQCVRGYDEQAARAFLEEALSGGRPVELAVVAFDLANSLLGPEDQRTTELLKWIAELGEQGKGGIRVGSSEELGDFLSARIDQTQKAFELYASGEIPIHVLSRSLGDSVASLIAFLSSQDWRTDIMSDRVPLFTRSGAHSSELSASVKPKRLIFDISALVIGEMLSLMEVVEETFSPLLIPSQTVPSLIRARDLFSSHSADSDDHETRSTRVSTEWQQAISELIERLRKGITRGTYRLMPEVALGDREKDSTEDLDTYCLREILLFQTVAGDVVWSDDRYLNKHSAVGSARIVSTIDILDLLRDMGSVSDETRFAALRTLREWRALFLPLSPDEICHCLIKGEEETTNLRVLSCWTATAFLNGSRLQLGSNARDMGEFKAFLGLHRSIEDSVIQIWSDTSSSEVVRSQRAQWVLEELHISAVAMRRLTRLPGKSENPLHLEALGLAGLFTHAFGYLAPSEWQAYFSWVDKQYVAFRSRNEPLLDRAISASIAEALVSRDAWKDLGLANAERRFVSFFVAQLPERLKRLILEDQDVSEELGFSPIVSVGEYSFDPDMFYAALAQAQVSGETEIDLLGEDGTVSITCEAGEPAHVFAVRRSNRVSPFGGEELALLSDSAKDRELFLLERRHWFDMGQEEFYQEIRSIAATPSLRQRVEKARDYKDSSTAVFYERIRALLASQGSVALTEFALQNPRSALHFFGLSSKSSIEENIEVATEEAAKLFLEEEGFLSVLRRLRGTPIELPKAMLKCWDGLGSVERRNVIREALKLPPSPVASSHLLRLLQACVDDSPAIARLMRRLAKRLLAEAARDEAEMFLAVLAWSESELAWNRIFRESPCAARIALAWAHADSIVSLLLEAGCDLAEVKRQFSGARTAHIPCDVFTRDLSYEEDIAFARRQRVETLVLSGLSYGLGSCSHDVLDEQLQNGVLAILFEMVDGSPTVRVPFLQDPRGFRDCTGSFLAGSWEEKLRPILGDDVARLWSTESTDRMIGAAFENLSQTGSDAIRGWVKLHAIMGEVRVHGNWSEHLLDSLKSLVFPELIGEDVEQALMVLHFACGQQRHFGDEVLLSKLSDAITRIALEFPAADPAHDTPLPGLLFDAIVTLASSESDPVSSSSRAVSLVRSVAAIRPDVVQVWRPAIWSFANQLSLEQGQPFWPLLLELRAAK